MKSSYLIAAVVVLVLAAFVWFSIQGGESPEAYKMQIEKERKEKDHFMKTGEDSPFPDSIAFEGLKYFAPDLKYKITATLGSIDQKRVVVLPTSDGKEKKYLEYAFAEFKMDGQACRLLILEIMDSGPYKGTLFLAFADETSARETYGAGRYLELKKVPGASTLELDFNKAYNPYCAYSDNFSCPFPPQGNRLTVAIRAGEKNYHD